MTAVHAGEGRAKVLPAPANITIKAWPDKLGELFLIGFGLALGGTFGFLAGISAAYWIGRLMDAVF